jgi:hypothetical protein
MTKLFSRTEYALFPVAASHAVDVSVVSATP